MQYPISRIKIVVIYIDRLSNVAYCVVMKQEDIKQKTVRARITDKEFTAVKECAKKNKWALADVIREAIKHFLNI